MDFQDALKTLKALKQCAIDAGIYHAWFISFGTLLGAIRPTKRAWGEEFRMARGFIEYDDDMDVSILTDKTEPDSCKKYISNIKDAGLFAEREKYAYDNQGNPLWCSCRKKPAPIGTKCCSWFWIRYKQYYWHTKGRNWADLAVGKFHSFRKQIGPDAAAVMLGIPYQYINELYEIEFEGEMFNVPMLSGLCLDHWYPGWHAPRKGGSSAKKILCIVPIWEDKNTWRII